MNSLHFSKAAMIIFIVLLGLTSCSSNNSSESKTGKIDFASNASKIFVDTEFEDQMEFDLILFSAKKIGSVKFVGFEGQNMDAAENLKATIEDVTVDDIALYKYKDLYTKIIRVHIDAEKYDDEISFERIVLDVDSVNRKLDFSTPLRHTFKGGNHFTEPMQISVIPMDFNSSYINNAKATAIYKFEATGDYTLNNIRFGDFLTADNVLYSIDGSEMIELKYPLKVKKGRC